MKIISFNHFWNVMIIKLGVISFFLMGFTIDVNARSVRTCADLSSRTILKKARKHSKTINRVAKKYHINRNFIKAIIAVETCYRSRSVSPAGAKGLMQLMPATARRFGVRNRFNNVQNIYGGTKYLAHLKRRYRGNLRKIAAAYNAGERPVDQYKGIPPYRETRRYVRDVMRVYGKLTRYTRSYRVKKRVKR